MVRVGVVGCTHGQFDAIYAHIEQFNQKHADAPVELLLCCGDVQCLRNTNDLECLACPRRYKKMNEFPAYYSGRKHAPIPTIVIGGNHEGSNYLQELHYGGWLAPNIFYLGAAGVINAMGLRIAGISGIYDAADYKKGHYERVPYTKKALYSVFHTREMQVHQLSHVTQPIDIMMSHDWPRKIEDYGDKEALFRRRPDFRDSIAIDNFGSVGGEVLLHKLKPRRWFAGHMHVRFEADVDHGDDKHTKFIGGDKCHPIRPWFEVIDIEPSGPASPGVQFDLEWLAILRATHHIVTRSPSDVKLPPQIKAVDQKDIEWIQERLLEESFDGEPWILEFEMTAPVDPDEIWTDGPLGNPQTDKLLELLELPHTVTSRYFSKEDAEGDGSWSDDDDDETDRHDNHDDYLESLESQFIGGLSF